MVRRTRSQVNFGDCNGEHLMKIITPKTPNAVEGLQEKENLPSVLIQILLRQCHSTRRTQTNVS